MNVAKPQKKYKKKTQKVTIVAQQSQRIQKEALGPVIAILKIVKYII